MQRHDASLPGVLMVGTGEYTTGIVAGAQQSKSDKRLGVVALVCFELRRLGRVGRLAMVGTRWGTDPSAC